MIEAYELVRRQREEKEAAEAEAEAQDQELAQPILRDIFRSCVELLEQEGQVIPPSERALFIPFVNKYRQIVPHRPFKAMDYEKKWLLEKDVQIDGKTERVTVFARGNSLRNLDEIGIGVREFSLVSGGRFDRRDWATATLHQDDSWYGDLAGTSDANFFKEVLTKVREQSPAIPVAS